MEDENIITFSELDPTDGATLQAIDEFLVSKTTDGKAMRVSFAGLMSQEAAQRQAVNAALNDLKIDLGGEGNQIKGARNGVAPLGNDRRIPSEYLPGAVDAIVEGYYNSDNGSFYEDSQYKILITPASNKIYVSKDTNKTYRYSGSAYIQISSSIVTGTGHENAYYGDQGEDAYQHSLVRGTGIEGEHNPHGLSKADIGLGNVVNVSPNDMTPTLTSDATAQDVQELNFGNGDKLGDAEDENHNMIPGILTRLLKLVNHYKAHISNTNNPHSVTKAQVGLEYVENKPMAQAIEQNNENYASSELVYNHVSGIQTALSQTITQNKSKADENFAKIDLTKDSSKVVKGATKIYDSSSPNPETLGSAKKPVYLDEGEFYECSDFSFTDIKGKVAPSMLNNDFLHDVYAENPRFLQWYGITGSVRNTLAIMPHTRIKVGEQIFDSGNTVYQFTPKDSNGDALITSETRSTVKGKTYFVNLKYSYNQQDELQWSLYCSSSPLLDPELEDDEQNETGVRTIGWFHTLCADVPTSELNPYNAIIPMDANITATDTYALVKPYFNPNIQNLDISKFRGNLEPDLYSLYYRSLPSYWSNIDSTQKGCEVLHPLAGFEAGDILPESVWCLTFKPSCFQINSLSSHNINDILSMVYDKATNTAVDIYPASKTASDPELGEIFNRPNYDVYPINYNTAMQLIQYNCKRLPNMNEYMGAALGAPGAPSLDIAYTIMDAGGDVSLTTRNISAIGCETIRGVYGEWLDGVVPNTSAGSDGKSSLNGCITAYPFAEDSGSAALPVTPCHIPYGLSVPATATRIGSGNPYQVLDSYITARGVCSVEKSNGRL